MTSSKDLQDFLTGFSGSRASVPDFGLHGRIRDKTVTEDELRRALSILQGCGPLATELASIDVMRRLHHLTKVMSGHAPRFDASEERRRLLAECVREADRIIGKPEW